MTAPDRRDEAIARARTLLAAVDFDNNGTVVAQVRTGGNGGLISLDTTRAADALRLALDQLDNAPREEAR